jgi:nucleotide sugar dehydrogenase
MSKNVLNISVVGLGKIGLPLAVQFASKGHTVSGVDIDQRVVDLVNDAVEPFPGEHGLADGLRDVVSRGLLKAVTNYSDAIADSDVVVVVVPLFVDDDARPDFGWMDSATRSIAEHLTPGTLVSYETTLPVGTTRERWVPLLAEGSGLTEGTDFHVVFSPERVLTGRVFSDLRKYPKLIGGLSSEGAQQARRFYEAVLDFDERPDLPRANGVWDLGSAEAAELAKLAETTYRDVNIGLANEFALYADRVGIDVHAVIDACNSQPYSHIHRPGIAVGGHCIPVYPRLYLWNDPEATIVRAARAANAAMPARTIDALATLHGDLTGETVVVLGAAYRGGVKETAFSGIFDAVDALRARGAHVLVHDPLYTADELSAYGFDSFEEGQGADALVLQADHQLYKTWGSAEVPGVKTVIDGRTGLDPDSWGPATFVRLGDGQAAAFQDSSAARGIL